MEAITESMVRVVRGADGKAWEFPPEGHANCPHNVSVYEKLADLRSLDGETVRLVGKTGLYGNPGPVKVEQVGDHDCAFISGRLIGGEIDGVARIEVKGDNGRYLPVKVYGQTYQEWRESR